MSATEVDAFLRRVFPQIYREGGAHFIVEKTDWMSARIRLPIGEQHLRPGGTISGPTMFSLADVSLYVAVLASIGPEALAVTTNLSINFLRKPPPADLIGDCTLFKLGKRLAVGEVALRSDGSDELVAHATGTYSIPNPSQGN